ncbi:MAG: M48 family metallopeptidase [Patescibacteria group bacterium]
MTAYSVQRANIYKTWILMLFFVGLIIALSFVFSYSLKNDAILYGGVAFAMIFNLLAYWYSDKLAMALNGAKEVQKNDLPEVYRLLENLAITTGIPVTPKLYLMQSPAINAFATGRTPKVSAVAVTSGLVDKLEKREIEGVLAHELSHIRNFDTRLMVIAGILAGVVALLANMFLRISFFGGRDEDSKGNAIVYLFAIVLAILAPVFAQVVQLAVSRKREFMADSGAAIITRNPESLASALEKISNDVNILKAEPSTSSLFIANPFRKTKGFQSWLGNLFSTHPPVEDRIRLLRGMVL